MKKIIAIAVAAAVLGLGAVSFADMSSAVQGAANKTADKAATKATDKATETATKKVEEKVAPKEEAKTADAKKGTKKAK
jgi:hypothetical protein